MTPITGPGLPTGDGTQNGAWYTFKNDGGSPAAEYGLPDKLRFKDDGGAVKAWSQWSYEGDRDLVASIASTFGNDSSTDVISKYEYVNDARGRRQGVIYTGAAVSSGHIDDWSYNDRNEILGTDRKSGTSSSSINTADEFDSTANAADRRFTYDNIGNRATSDIGEAIEDPNQPTWDYTRNELNQYTTVVQASPFLRQFFEHDADGNRRLQFAVGDIDGDGDVDVTDLGLLLSNYGDTCSSHAGLTDQEFTRADADGDCELTIADLGGLLSGYGAVAAAGNFVKFTWDAENRLIEVEPLPRSETNVTIPAGYRRVQFGYDYKGRRVEKRVYKRDSSDNTAWAANPIERRRFVWNGWLMLRETIETDAAADGTVDSTRVKTYTWGRDLGGGLESVGGIGGLLSVSDDATTTGTTSDDLNYIYLYDANGNVGQLCNLAANDASSSIVAKYEYDAYGTPTVASGAYATSNTYRFSTKPWDDETGLGYWGYRYYDSRLGRWMSRDPIEEKGGLLLHAFVKNSPVRLIDNLGRCVPDTKKANGVDTWFFNCETAHGPCDKPGGWTRSNQGGVIICECGGVRYPGGSHPLPTKECQQLCSVYTDWWLKAACLNGCEHGRDPNTTCARVCDSYLDYPGDDTWQKWYACMAGCKNGPKPPQPSAPTFHRGCYIGCMIGCATVITGGCTGLCMVLCSPTVVGGPVAAGCFVACETRCLAIGGIAGGGGACNAICTPLCTY